MFRASLWDPLFKYTHVFFQVKSSHVTCFGQWPLSRCDLSLTTASDSVASPSSAVGWRAQMQASSVSWVLWHGAELSWPLINKEHAWEIILCCCKAPRLGTQQLLQCDLDFCPSLTCNLRWKDHRMTLGEALTYTGGAFRSSFPQM